ncbi:Gfo/Idh/MocA family protein [Dermacoccaceae bacterium W4C1]
MSLTLPPPRTLDPMTAPTLRWGVLGAGGIARSFCDALRTGTTQQVVAVGSRSAERAQAFAAETGVPRAYGSYEHLVADPEVDVIYVASPHSQHHEHALLALAAGKPVLVEKAFALNAAQAREVAQAATAAGLFCMEAMWTRFLPHIDVIRQVVQEGLLGEVHTLLADHGQPLFPDGPRRLSDPELAGGALLDLGIYPVSFAWGMLGPFEQVRASGTLTDQGVDADDVITLSRADGSVTASLNTTMLVKTPTTATICGTQGRVEVDGDFYMPNHLRLFAGTDPLPVDAFGETESIPHRGMRFEAAEVARCITEQMTGSPLMPMAQTIEIMQTLDEIRRQVGVRYPGE